MESIVESTRGDAIRHWEMLMHKGLAIGVAIVLSLRCGGVRAEESASSAAAVALWTEAGANYLGTPSTDGKYLSCVDTSTGDLALRELATGEMRRLTHKHPRRQKDEFAYFSAISPDSKRVAYAWFNDEKFYDLRVVGADGEEGRTLFRNPEAGFVQPCAWSPDGSEILTLFFRKDNISQIAMVSAADGEVRVLKSLSWFYPKKMQISPDGKHIVYDSLERPGGAARDIMLLAADGSREVKLIDDPANDTYPLWTVDGGAVVFLSDRAGSLDVWRVAVRDGKPVGDPEPLVRGLGRVLPMGITGPGDYIFGLRTGLTDVYVADFDSKSGELSSEPRLATPRYRGVNSAPDWSPDGKHLAFLTARGSENYGHEKRAISIRNLATGDEPALAGSSRLAAAQQPDLDRVSGHTDVSGEERDLPTRMSHIESVRWSPDANSLMLSGSDRRGRSGLFLADAESGRLRTLVIGENSDFRGLPAVWSAKGDRIYYLDGKRLLLRDPESRTSAPLLSYHADLFYPALAPDGSRLALATGDGKVIVLPVADGPVAEVRPEWEVPTPAKGYLTGLEWTRDGDKLLMTIGRDGKDSLWLVAVRTGSARQVDLQEGAQAGVRIRPDGDGIAFVVGAPKTEIWALEGLLSNRESAKE